MRHSSQAAGQLSDATRTDAAERVAQAERIIEFLRHRYPQKTAAYIEAFTGEPAGPIPNIGPFLTEWEAEQALHASLRSNPKALS